MIPEFYIEEGHRRLGPYDMMSMVRKIRNGQVVRESLLYIADDDTPRNAMEIEEFYHIFEEMENDLGGQDAGKKRELRFIERVRSGVDFLALNPVMSVYTGVFLLSLIVVSAGLALILPNGGIVTVIASISGVFLFLLYQIAILRKTRMQLFTMAYLIAVVKRRGMSLLLVSSVLGFAVFAIPGALATLGATWALVLILFPGSLLMMFFFYSGLLVEDRGCGGIEALGQSFHAMRALGMDNFIVLYLLLLVNFICATLPIFLLVSLPITLSALCEIYDESFNDFAQAA